MASKFYVVKKGKIPGIYKTWSECEEQVKGYPNALFKSFKTMNEAEQYLNGGTSSLTKTEKIDRDMLKEEEAIIYVDGSYENNIKRYGYGGIIFWRNQKEIVEGNGSEKELVELRNVAGELKATIKSLEYAIKKGVKKVYLHYDYVGIENWYTKEWKANTQFTKEYVSFADKTKELLEVVFIKVKAHTGDQFNEEVDKIAKNAVFKEYTLKEVNEEINTKHCIINKKGIVPNFNIQLEEKVIDTETIMKNFKELWKKEKRKLCEIQDMSIIIDIKIKEAIFKIATENGEIIKNIKL